MRIFTSLPDIIKKYKGTKKGMNNLLDRYLEQIPDQPEYTEMVPGGKTLHGKCSNSIA